MWPPIITESLKSIAKIKLSGGVVGKITLGVMVACILIAVLAYAAHNIWLFLVAVVLIFLLTFVMSWRLINFADRHPAAALLEGAQFVRHHEQTLQAAKGGVQFEVDPLDREQPFSIKTTPASRKIALTPETDASPDVLEGEGENE